MAEDAVDEAIKVFGLTPKQPSAVDISGMGIESDVVARDGSCQTRRVRLIGTHGYSASLPSQLTEKYGLDHETAESLALNYGDRAWEVASMSAGGAADSFRPARLSPQFPTLEGEIRYAARNEYAQTASDFLGRRTRIAFLDWQVALEALPRVIDVMSEELGWSSVREAQEWRETVQYLVSMGLPREMESLTREEVLDRTHKTTRGRDRRPVKSIAGGAKREEAGFAGVAAPVSA
jgi:glycerol-3-phosphate dehydrogenase